MLIILFDATSKIKFYGIDKSMKEAFWLFVITLVINLVIISAAAKVLFGLTSFASVVFALLISCVEFSVIYPRHHEPRNKITELLKDESLISCAFILLIPFLIIYFTNVFSPEIPGTIVDKIIPAATNIFGGIAVGLVVALILFRLINKTSEKISSLILAAGLLLAFVLSLQIDGNGLIAVATIGLIFGNVFLKHKKLITKHEHSVYLTIELFVFIFIGVVIGLPAELGFYKLSILLFLLYIVLRFVATNIALRHYDFRERLELSFFVPKGVVTIVLAFALLTYSFTGVVLMTQLLLIFFVYSLVFDTILDKVGFYRHR